MWALQQDKYYLMDATINRYKVWYDNFYYHTLGQLIGYVIEIYRHNIMALVNSIVLILNCLR